MRVLEDCVLCPRECHVNRIKGEKGYCGMDGSVFAARAALHMWEEPCISGENGSGAVFFTGCSLQCCFCQNREIAKGNQGMHVTVDRLTEIFIELWQKGAANINLVTGVHYVPQIIKALEQAKKRGMDIPVVYNSSGYEKEETIDMLNGYIDVYLPDFKYMDQELARKFSHAQNYPEITKKAIEKMTEQTKECYFDEKGYIKKGTIVRHLILPGHTRDSIQILKYLHEKYGNKIYISIMNQYTPVVYNAEYQELNRKVTKREYEKVLNAALEMGIENGFFQEGKTAEQSFIPAFNFEGIRNSEKKIPVNGRRPVLSYRRV